ncbi:GNAT family protein [Mesorhizobium sp. Z1-4]|uniref:GNAT family N-acetyltransferase n=1 Tax=Mesorhizobium sp. Z1-4 TaxID=2448478 RepID=UPI0013DE8221|nr:GNAT family protein [Mesorhizobium sp. Z1-4]
MISDLADWTPREAPRHAPMEGRFVRLVPLDAAAHGDALFGITENDPQRFRYLFEPPPADRQALQPWLDLAQASTDPLWFTVIDQTSGRVVGRQSFMRIDKVHGVIEIGSILWSSLMARSPASTEALFLFAKHAFDDLGYRRFEWKCNNLNEPSKQAALRYGFSFEGVFRQHMVVKGQNRDTAWYAMTDRDWPLIRSAFEAWLDPANFDLQGQQRERLGEIRAALAGAVS